MNKSDVPPTTAWGGVFLPHHFRVESPAFHWSLLRHFDGPERFAAAVCPRGHAKCLSVDTNIQKADGHIAKAGAVRPGDSLIALRESDLKLVQDRVISVSQPEQKECLSISVRSNRQLTATGEHRVFTFDGWKLAKDLIPKKDYIAVPRRINAISSAGTMPIFEARMIGYLISDGSLSAGNCTFVKSNQEVVADFMDCAAKMGFVVGERGKYGHSLKCGSSSPRNWLRSLRLWGCKSETKRVPEIMFSQPESVLWAFVDSLMVTDGWFAKQAGSAGISLSNEPLIDDIRAIFTRLGIVTTKRFKKTTALLSHVLIIGNGGVNKLLDHCSLIGKREAAEFIAKTKGYSLTDIYPNRVKALVNKRDREIRKHGIRVDRASEITHHKLSRLIDAFDTPALKRLRDADVYWDRVESVVSAGTVTTVDIQMEQHQSFIANDMVVHNSSLITLADLLKKVAYEQISFGIIVSDTHQQAADFLAEISRECEENELLRATYPGLLPGKIWNRGNLVFANGIRIRAMGLGQKIRGAKHKGRRPDYILLDDAENDEAVENFERREKLRRWFYAACLPALDPKGKIRVVGTILHRDSLLSRLLRTEGWKCRIWRALSDAGEALWEAWQSREKLLNDKKLAEESGLLDLWYQEFQGVSRAPEGQAFKPEDILYFEKFPRDADGKPLKAYKSLYVDLAIGDQEKHDFNAFTVVYATHDGYWYVVEAFRRKCDPSEIINIIRKLHQKHGFDVIGIESVQYQKALAFFLNERASEDGEYLPIETVTPDNDKRRRILGIQPYFRAGRIKFRPTISPRLEEELLHLDDIDHDDMADSLAGHVFITIRPEPPKARAKRFGDATSQRAADHRAEIRRQARLQRRGIDAEYLGVLSRMDLDAPEPPES